MTAPEPAGYASGFRQLVGYEIEEVGLRRAVMSLTLGPQHMNRSGITHGGVILTLIDAAIGYAGCYCTVPGNVRSAASITIATSFLRPTKTGKIRAVGKIRPGGLRIFFGAVEVFDEAGHLVAVGEGTYKYRRGSETPEGRPATRGKPDRGR